MSIAIQFGEMTKEPWSEKLLLVVAGPLTTTIVGSLLVGIIVNTLLDRKRQKDSDREFRKITISEISRVASSFYIDMVLYNRWATTVSDKVRSKDTAKVDALRQSYRQFQIEAAALESRIDAYFAKDNPREWWHATTDLLTVRYHHVMRSASDTTFKRHQRQAEVQHSGLTLSELWDQSTVIKCYKIALKQSIIAIMTYSRADAQPSAASKKHSGNVLTMAQNWY